MASAVRFRPASAAGIVLPRGRALRPHGDRVPHRKESPRRTAGPGSGERQVVVDLEVSRVVRLGLLQVARRGLVALTVGENR